MSYVAITGGCGYVGSHVAKAVQETGYKTIVIDRNAIGNEHTYPYANVIVVSDFDSKETFDILTELKPVAIIHLAANSLVGPSVSNPTEYYENNTVRTKRLLDFAVKENIGNFLFSSSSSVYGLNHIPPINEEAFTRPLTSYGKSKLMTDMMLTDYSTAYGMNAISFRYFNACGASPDGELGQVKGASHLIAKIMDSVLDNTTIDVYGGDYNTPDGTAIRDYTHVVDIANAHVLGLKFLMNIDKPIHEIINLGSGNGNSVMEIIKSVERVLNIDVKYNIMSRRKGDPECVFADNTKAKTLLSWNPEHDLDSIIKTAYNWYTVNE